MNKCGSCGSCGGGVAHHNEILKDDNGALKRALYKSMDIPMMHSENLLLQ